MPRSKSIKTVALDVILFVGIVTVVSHLGAHFWERYMIQMELSQMKTSLHYFKDTVSNIATAYDKLHKDLLGLTEITAQKNKQLNAEPLDYRLPKSPHPLENKPLDAYEKYAIEAKSETFNVPPKADKMTEKNFIKCETKNAAVMSAVPIKNMTTMTKYPLKSTGVGINYEEHLNEVCNKNAVCNDFKRKCYNNYDNCCKDAYTYWRF